MQVLRFPHYFKEPGRKSSGRWRLRKCATFLTLSRGQYYSGRGAQGGQQWPREHFCVATEYEPVVFTCVGEPSDVNTQQIWDTSITWHECPGRTTMHLNKKKPQNPDRITDIVIAVCSGFGSTDGSFLSRGCGRHSSQTVQQAVSPVRVVKLHHHFVSWGLAQPNERSTRSIHHRLQKKNLPPSSPSQDSVEKRPTPKAYLA
jgi:hypothetical protein